MKNKKDTFIKSFRWDLISQILTKIMQRVVLFIIILCISFIIIRESYHGLMKWQENLSNEIIKKEGEKIKFQKEKECLEKLKTWEKAREEYLKQQTQKKLILKTQNEKEHQEKSKIILLELEIKKKYRVGNLVRIDIIHSNNNDDYKWVGVITKIKKLKLYGTWGDYPLIYGTDEFHEIKRKEYDKLKVVPTDVKYILNHRDILDTLSWYYRRIPTKYYELTNRIKNGELD